MAQTMTMEEALAYFNENPYGKLRCLEFGQSRTIRMGNNGNPMIMKPRSKNWGWTIHPEMWKNLTVFRPLVHTEADYNAKMAKKFRTKAEKAGFTNRFIRLALKADPTKSPYANGLTTGSGVDGKIISVKSIGKEYPEIVVRMREAMKNREEWRCSRWLFRGYDMTIQVVPIEDNTPEFDQRKGDLRVYLSLEYRNCGNGYYYELINEDEFIGVDID